MHPSDRARLTSALRDHVAAIAADLRDKLRAPGPARERAERLRKDEQVGDDYDVWTDLLARRGAVLWVLKSVYVRVLEDRGLIVPGRILDREAQELFERLAPNLGDTAFLRWVYRDLASAGGLPELFTPQPAEIAEPSDKLSRALLGFWRHRDPDTGAHWSFADETFEGELMGDLYQELDPVVKDRFALCQTPDFVRGFILDRTLTPAIEAFGADQVRLLDPACGSGHFLIDGLKRLVAATATQHPDRARRDVVIDCLGRVVGIDLNDYACALARARLIMTAAELCGGATLAEAAALHPHVYWADGLEQVERDDALGQQLDLLDAGKNEAPRASLTRPEVRRALRDVIAAGFQAVVANPPYITEKDKARKAYHREKVGKNRRYVSAYREYSLASPFTERCFQLAVKDGFVGLITSNNFMKREFGKALIEKVLARLDLTLVVDTSQAYIPFHGTPTVLLFGRNRRPPGKPAGEEQSDTVRAVMGKRGETGTPVDPANGQVWTSIVEGWNAVGFENEFVSVAEVPRTTLGKHPWSLGGGGASQLREQLQHSSKKLSDFTESIGFGVISGEDNVFLQPIGILERIGVSHRLPLVAGEVLRDWVLNPVLEVVWPNESSGERLSEGQIQDVLAYFWHYRTSLKARKVFGSPIEDRGLKWWEVREVYKERFRTPLSIAFAFVATHNHFVLDRGGKVFKQSAPVIKLPADASEDDHLALLGLLNSSTACFWMKQVFHCKGSQGINEGMKSALWEQFFEFDSTKIKQFPVVPTSKQTIPYARALDALASKRIQRSIDSVLSDETAWRDASSLRTPLDNRRTADLADLYRMIALQEELDWLCYRLYGIDDNVTVIPPDDVEPIPPTWLPWVLDLAERDAAVLAAMERGDDPGELPTVWFERHRWTPLTELPDDASARWRDLVAKRREQIRNVRELALIEGSAYKRRWYKPDYDKDEAEALAAWLADRVEAIASRRATPATIAQLTAALQDDPRVLAVAELLAGQRDFALQSLIADRLRADAVPNHPFHRYKPKGLDKRQVWEAMWDAQRREDAGETVTPPVPPKYTTADFRKPEYFRLRGKLDVPKERFIAFTEVPGRDPADTLYGWAGWTPAQRLRALLAIDEDLEDAGVPIADRVGVLDSAWRLLPDVAREDAKVANRLKAELQALVGADGPSREMLDDWQQRFPPPRARPKSRKRKKRS